MRTFRNPQKCKIVLFCLALGLMVVPAHAQKYCNRKSTGWKPLSDLAGQTFRGFTGGKYSTGNTRPSLQRQRALEQAQKIKPLDTAGNYHPGGSVVFAAIGASNPATEFNQFMAYADTFRYLNPTLQLVNTCIGGTGIQKMNAINDAYWSQAAKKLKDLGFTFKQVQIVWIEQEHTQNADTAFPAAPLSLIEDYRQLLSVVRQLFPNVQMVYLNQRAYAGYVDTTPGRIGKGLHFPRDYYNGWAIKWLIEKQLNNEQGFRYQSPEEIPFVDWAESFWADGSVPRNDGLYYDCMTDFGGDGLHLSLAGEQKTGGILFNYFKQDSIARLWFYRQTNATAHLPKAEEPGLIVFPNPANVVLRVKLPAPALLTIYIQMGQTIEQFEVTQREFEIPVDTWNRGVYIMRALTGTGVAYDGIFVLQ